MSFRAFSSRRSSLTQIFAESCVDFEVAHLSVLMVWRLPYPEVPTLIILWTIADRVHVFFVDLAHMGLVHGSHHAF